MPIPEVEVDVLRRIAKANYDPKPGAIPSLGAPVEMVDDMSVRGILVEKTGSMCRVAICLDSIGRAVILSVPIESLRIALIGCPAAHDWMHPREYSTPGNPRDAQHHRFFDLCLGSGQEKRHSGCTHDSRLPSALHKRKTLQRG
jgi:hypothetical protein